MVQLAASGEAWGAALHHPRARLHISKERYTSLSASSYVSQAFASQVARPVHLYPSMKIQRSPHTALLALAPLTLLLSGCEIIGNIFKAGVWVGVLGVFAVVALLIWGFRSMMSR